MDLKNTLSKRQPKKTTKDPIYMFQKTNPETETNWLQHEGRRRLREMVVTINGYISFGSDENALKLNSGNCCSTF